ncbi:methyltransferase domain-containing protein [Chloroflexota bacterium]
MNFGYIPDYKGKSFFFDLFLKIFGYPYAARRNEARLVCNLLDLNKDECQILDIGCGDGVWTNELLKRGVNIKGLDISSEDVAMAETRAKKLGLAADYIVHDAQEIPFSDNTFTDCIAICVLEHIPDDNKVFNEVYRILKPKGCFVLSVPSNKLPFLMKILVKLPIKLKRRFASSVINNSRTEADLFRETDAKFNHYRRYDEDVLKEKARNAGFTIEEIKYNLKFFGNLINGIIHSFKSFEFTKKKEGYEFKSCILYGLTFPIFYLFHLLDNFIPVKGCTLVVKLRKI